jgi:hypothetical protein
MGALFQDGLADGTVGRNITLTLTKRGEFQLRQSVNAVTVLVQLRVNNSRGRSTRIRERIGIRSTDGNKRYILILILTFISILCQYTHSV